MATPTTNSVPVTQLSKSGLPHDEAALIDGTKWGNGGYGTGVSLTYSFPGFPSASYINGYGGDEEEWADWFVLNSSEQSAVLQALNVMSASANVSFTQLADNSTTVGELRFAGSSSIADYAHAYSPESGPEGGDVWFSDDWNPSGNAVVEGTYEYLTILHEIGHALGLKHPFEGGSVLSDDLDNYLYTVMSYSVNAGDHPAVHTASFYPTTLMYLDLVALQTLYGQSTIANSGNTDYVYHENQTYWETINDSGGIDTITYDSSTGGRIDLSNATFSHMGVAITFSDGTSTRDTISLGPSVIIENATGGSGNDDLIGNGVANTLDGGAGNDTMTGAAGNDVLDGAGGVDNLRGGAGKDTLNGGGSADTLNGGAGSDTLDGGTGNDRLIGGGGIDVLIHQAADTSVQGGAGTDKLRIDGSGVVLDLTQIANTVHTNIEVIDLRSSGDNTLTVARADVLAISPTDTLKVNGGAGDTVNAGSGWTDFGVNGGYHEYQKSGATLLVDTDIVAHNIF